MFKQSSLVYQFIEQIAWLYPKLPRALLGQPVEKVVRGAMLSRQNLFDCLLKPFNLIKVGQFFNLGNFGRLLRLNVVFAPCIIFDAKISNRLGGWSGDTVTSAVISSGVCSVM
ncbi:MAG: hypothetical protein K6T90_22570 [Leptolyngbyaceae cyanobacterium HOT.MB2.61]|nr:hypothetical protein [Leptolyngbyaceae cyanobacterium HOT.MB2.61]